MNIMRYRWRIGLLTFSSVQVTGHAYNQTPSPVIPWSCEKTRPVRAPGLQQRSQPLANHWRRRALTPCFHKPGIFSQLFSPRAGRGERTRKSCVLQPLLRLIVLLLWALPLQAQKFFPDDPLTQEPPPFPVNAANFRELNPLHETVIHQFGKPGERHPANGVIPALSANTLGETMDGLWFVNRHARQRLSAQELLEGSARGEAPSVQQKWRVLTVRKYGIRPGLLIHDAKNQLYLLRFDPLGRLEMSTGAEMIGVPYFSRFRVPGGRAPSSLF